MANQSMRSDGLNPVAARFLTLYFNGRGIRYSQRDDGILGIAEWDLFIGGWHGLEYKIRPSSDFDPQYSSIPLILSFFKA
jgi:hypothetical protein